jgi:hypothetical protein
MSPRRKCALLEHIYPWSTFIRVVSPVCVAGRPGNGYLHGAVLQVAFLSQVSGRHGYEGEGRLPYGYDAFCVSLGRQKYAVLFWLAVLCIVVRLTLADSKAVLLAYYASLRLFSCSYYTYILRSAVAQPNLLARRSRPLMSGLPRRIRGRG